MNGIATRFLNEVGEGDSVESAMRSLFSRAREAGTDGILDESHFIADIQLLHDVGLVSFHGLLTDAQKG